MATRMRPIVVLAALMSAAWASRGAAQQTVIPTLQHETLDFELKSLRDKVTLYLGDPQELVRMNVRPQRTVKPRIEVTSQSEAVVRIIDSVLYDKRSTD